jgi:hypothetical protein
MGEGGSIVDRNVYNVFIVCRTVSNRRWYKLCSMTIALQLFVNNDVAFFVYMLSGKD